MSTRRTRRPFHRNEQTRHPQGRSEFIYLEIYDICLLAPKSAVQTCVRLPVCGLDLGHSSGVA